MIGLTFIDNAKVALYRGLVKFLTFINPYAPYIRYFPTRTPTHRQWR